MRTTTSTFFLTLAVAVCAASSSFAQVPVPVRPVDPVQAYPVRPVQVAPVNRGVVMVLPIRGKDLDEEVRERFQHGVHEVTNRMLAGAGYDVLPGDAVRRRLDDVGVDPFGVCRESCNMDAVRSLGATFLVSGNIHSEDVGFVAVLRLFDGRTGAQLSTVRLQGEMVKYLHQQLEANANMLFGPLLAPPPPPPLRKIWAASARASSQYGDPNWSAMQAVGAPNTNRCGSIVTAWATRQPDAPGEWLELYYESRMPAVGVDIVESFNPGAVAAVEVRLPDGRWMRVSTGPDTTRACPGTYRVMFPEPLMVDAVRLRLASEMVPGWNEIDAAALLVR